MRHPLIITVLAIAPQLAGAQKLVPEPGVMDSASEARVANALSAAPSSVAAGATVMDMSKKILRRGTNGWICLPDMPDVPNNSPMCLDATWLDWLDAFMARRPPVTRQLGIGYMLQGDMPVSNVDPFATTSTNGNQWVQNAGPHIMLIVPDVTALESLPTDPTLGVPWLMWKGTPFAHVMVPAVPTGREQ